MPIVNWWSFNTYDLNPSVTLNHGTHTIHAGFEALYQAKPSQTKTRHQSERQSGAGSPRSPRP